MIQRMLVLCFLLERGIEIWLHSASGLTLSIAAYLRYLAAHCYHQSIFKFFPCA